MIRLFYNGKEIDGIVRTFEFNNRLRAEIKIGGDKLIVDRKELKELSELTLIDKVNVTIDRVEIISEKINAFIANSDIEQLEVHSTFPRREVEELAVHYNTSLKELEAPTIDDELSSLIVDKEKEEIAEEVVVKDNTVEPLKNIVAKKLSNNRNTKLGDQESTTFANFVKRNKLDVNAINNVLDGKAKTHKGFSFSFE